MNLLEHRLSQRRRNCRERRRYLAELEALAGRLRADEKRLQAEIERAVALAPGSGEIADGLVARHRKLLGSVVEIDQRLVEAAAVFATAERDLKRHELALAERSEAAPRRARGGAAARRQRSADQGSAVAVQRPADIGQPPQ